MSTENPQVWKNIQAIDRESRWNRLRKPVRAVLGLLGVAIVTGVLYGLQLP